MAGAAPTHKAPAAAAAPTPAHAPAAATLTTATSPTSTPTTPEKEEVSSGPKSEEVSSGPKTDKVALADTEGAKHEGEVSSGPEPSKHERLHELAQLAISESEIAARRKSGEASLGQLASAQPPAQSPQSPQSAGAEEEEQGVEDIHQMAIEELKRRHDAEVQGEM